MNKIKNIRQRLTLVAAAMATVSLFAEVVTWSGEAQDYSSDATIGALHVTADTAVSVASGCSLTVDELVGDALITKSGDGTLAVKNFSANSRITATAGAVRFASDSPTDTTAFDSDSAFLHMDASNADSLTTAGTDAQGRTLVSSMADVRGTGHPTASNAGYAAGIEYNKPWLEVGLLNGRNVLDFGSYYDSATEGYGAAFSWDTVSKEIREVFLVYSDAHGSNGQFLLGCKWPGNVPGYNDYTYHYHRGADGALFEGTYAHKNVREGQIYVDGLACTMSTVLASGFHVIRLVQNGAATASAFACDRSSIRRGGMRLAEAIVFNANLDAVESRLLEMRLQQKWLPKERTIAAITLSGTASLTVDKDVKLTVRSGSLSDSSTVLGEGEAVFEVGSNAYSFPAKSIAKTASGSVTVRATAARRVRVDSGSLTIATAATKLTPALHLDASISSCCEVNKGKIQYWNDVRGNAVNRGRNYTDAQMPLRTENAQNGLAAMNFGDFYREGHWPEANEPKWLNMKNAVTDIRDVFMVVADTDDMRTWAAANDSNCQFLLCHNSSYDFHRGSKCKILETSYGCGSKANTKVYLDGATCAKNDVLPEGFHLVRITPHDACKFNQLCKERSGNCWGGLKYGEILVYTGAKLSDADAADVSSYLLNKWGLPNASGKGVSYESLEIAENATLGVPVCSSTAALSGAGTVQGDLALADEFAIKMTAGKPLAVTGKLTLPKSGTIDISGDANAFGRNEVITLVSASSTVVAANPTWTVTGTFTASRRTIKVFADSEGLKAKIVPPGLTIIVW